MRVLQITDLHLHSDPSGTLRGTNTFDTLRASLAVALAAGPYDAILMTGDLVQDEAGGYAHLRSLLPARHAPVLCLPGNHDIADALMAACAEYGYAYLGPLSLGPWRIVGLDSTVSGEAGGQLAADALAQFDATLAAQGTAPTIVCLHHPPVALGSRWLDGIGLAASERFFAVVDKHPQVRAILFGHAHQAYDGRHGHVAVLGCPATSRQFLPHSDDFAVDDLPPGWRTLDLADDGTLTSQVHWLPQP